MITLISRGNSVCDGWCFDSKDANNWEEVGESVISFAMNGG